MKKISTLVFLVILMISCSKSIYTPMVNKPLEHKNIIFFKLNEIIINSQDLIDNLNNAKFTISDDLSFTSKESKQYVDNRGVFIYPTFNFILKKGLILKYFGKEKWGNQNGYIFTTPEGKRLFFKGKEYDSSNRKILYFYYFEYEGIKYKLETNNIHIICQLEEKPIFIKVK